MASKKSTDLTKEQEEVLEKVQEEAFTSLCGHINKQHVGINGRLEDLACTLQRGHEGDHQTEYECLRPFDGSFAHVQLKRYPMSQAIVNGALVPMEYVKVKEIAYWSDAAGVPVSEVVPDLEGLAKRRNPLIDGNAYAERHGNAERQINR